MKKKKKTNIEKYIEEMLEKYLENQYYFNDTEANKKKNIFLDRFISSEYLIKKILYYYYQMQGRFTKSKDIYLNIQSIKNAVAFFNFPIEEEVLIKIFGSESKRGCKSCKKLRDSLVHNFSSNDAYEVEKRFEELNNYLDIFINNIVKNGGK